MKDILMKDFQNIFNTVEKAQVFFAPGRVNLIGEHTDYNGGHVFPCALTFGTYAAARRIEEPVVRMYSKNFESMGIIEFSLDDLRYEAKHGWANYPKGVIYNFINNNFPVNNGLEVLYYGNIPNGAGLSSSASIEVLTAVLLKDLYDFDINMMRIARLCKNAENNFIGVNCGIMDQFAIAFGKKDNAIFLNANTLKYDYIKIALDNASIVISNTNKRRDLADSKYNERRAQCESALKDIREELNIHSLGDMDEGEFESCKHFIRNEINAKRAKHAVYENRRTMKAVESLREKDIAEFGRLMNESHISLRDDYEVTGIELDTLVELAWRQKGVFGSRMTGAGFGGCTVSIVKNDSIDDFIKNVGDEYARRIGYAANFYVAQIGGGARKL